MTAKTSKILTTYPYLPYLLFNSQHVKYGRRCMLRNGNGNDNQLPSLEFDTLLFRRRLREISIRYVQG